MGNSRSEELTGNYYEWEQRHRGWNIFPYPVELEPVFKPFSDQTKDSIPVIDDGKLYNTFTYFSESIKNAFKPRKNTLATVEDESVPVAKMLSTTNFLCGFSISMPEDEKLKPDQISQFLIMLSSCQAQLSFEILATCAAIRIQFVCREEDSIYLQSQIKAYFPHCMVQEQSEALTSILNDSLHTCFADFGLQQEFSRPINMPDRFEVDPLTGLFGVLEHLGDEEQVVIQILFKGAVKPWAQSIIRSVTDSKGDSFFLDAPEMPKLAIEKVSSPLYGVVIRTVAQSTTSNKANIVLDRVAGALIQSSVSATNALIPLNNDGLKNRQFITDIIQRQSHRVGMLLNANELATFVHYPFAISSKKLERDIGKTKAIPKTAEGNKFILGKNVHQGVERIASISPVQRLKHMHVIGVPGTGKSTLLQSCIVQDILLGNGAAVLDPHGDLIESILPYIPENRQNDVIIVDPADAAYPVGFNIFTAHSDIEKEILASDLVSVFRRLSTSWGDQMNSVLANAILAFLESNKGGTLIDLRRFLIEKLYRDEFLKTVDDPNVVYYWKKTFSLLKSNSIGPILTRLDSFLRPKVIRNMVAQRKSLDFEDILDSQRILFIKLSQGLIGTENSYLLGTFFVSKIYQAAMARQAQAKTERKDFFLYIDEFQNFITPSMSSILSGTRKYGLGTILAHQDMQQLVKQDSELASSVISNAGTRVCFRVGDIDAKRFEDGFSFFEAKDLQNLGVGQAIVRMERPDYDFNITTSELSPPDMEKGARDAVIALSRKKYGTPREEVEKTLEYLRGDDHQEEIRQPVKEFKAAEPLKKQPPITEPEKPDSVIGILTLDEKQKAKTTENLARQKELSQHRYLQTLIKRMAESRGYKAMIEETTPDGQGRVDVSLEKNGKRIACEIGVTTTKVWEAHNIEKCLAAGYEVVIAVPIEPRAGEMIQQIIKKNLKPEFYSRVFVMEADALFHYLDKEVAKEAATETRTKGYRVKVEYDSVSAEDHKRKREAVTKLVADSAKKKKDKE